MAVVLPPSMSLSPCTHTISVIIKWHVRLRRLEIHRQATARRATIGIRLATQQYDAQQLWPNVRHRGISGDNQCRLAGSGFAAVPGHAAGVHGVGFGED